MNIKTITCHDVYNYGASLQAYALQAFLEKNGHNVEIIDYLPDYKHVGYYWFEPTKGSKWEKLGNKLPILRPIFGLWCRKTNFKYLGRISRFDSFKRNQLHCTNTQYHNINDLNKNKPQADLFIAGSDQIWNTKFINGTDPAFYCDFVGDKSKCISYAASFATSDLDPQWKDFVKSKLANFKAISLREKTGVAIANSLGYETTNVLDPVFLLDKEEWISICKKKHYRKYIIVYDFLHNDPRIEYLCKKVAKERNLKIYSLNAGGPCPYADKCINNAGPIQFLEWIKGAEFVISNSFHATAFSIIFERNFFTLPLIGHKNSSRITDLLYSLGLSDRFVEDTNIAPIENIVFGIINPKLEDARNQSRNWLIKHL